MTILSVSFFFIGCTQPQNQKKEQPGVVSITGSISRVDELFNDLDQMEMVQEGDLEQAIEINEHIRREIEQIAAKNLLHKMTELYGKGNHHFAFTCSPDKKVAVFSWHSKLDTFGFPIKNIVIFHDGKELVPTSLYGTPVIYEQLFQFTDEKGHSIYIMVGNSRIHKMHKIIFWAYSIQNGQLQEVFVFPDRKSSYVFKSKFTDKTPFIFHDKRNIRISNTENPTIGETHLVFDGKRFVINTNKAKIVLNNGSDSTIETEVINN